MFEFWSATGLRVHEFVQLRLEDFKSKHRAGWLMKVTGKGRTTRSVAVPNQAREALQRYLQARGLPVRPAQWEPTTLVVAPPRGNKPLSPERAWAIMKRVVREAAARVRKANPQLAARLEASSTHWMRHTHATQALAAGAPLKSVRASLGHSSLATTSMYVHTDEETPLKDMNAVLPGSKRPS